jgi:hypothetical protein
MFYVKKEGGAFIFADGSKLLTIASSPTSNKKFEFNDERFSQFFGGAEYHRMQLGGSGTGVYFFRSGISGSLGGFIVGGNSLIGTEDISLQGDVLTNGSLTLKNSLKHLGYTSSTAAPTVTQLPSDKDYSIHKDTSAGTVYLAYNDGGTIKTVTLT